MRAAIAIAVVAAAVSVAAGSWSVLNDNFATIAVAISCKDANTCIAPVGVNGEGSFIWLSTDGGQTWDTENEPFELMFLGAAMSKKDGSAVVADELTILYNNASATAGSYQFSHGYGDYLASSQNVEVFNGNWYGAAGEDEANNGNGVSISTDGGKDWKWYNISILNTFARYGAYPSQTTWYISAGEWPENVNAPTDATYRQLSSRVHIEATSPTDMTHRLFPASPTTTDAGWKAQIVKTTDGGKTWTSLFYDETFYFNQIGCTDETHCCAVGEADTSSEPGVRIYCTTDGTTWNRIMYNDNPNMSIMALRFIDSQNGWAAGGDLAEFGITGYFWQTTDGGQTWTNSTVPGQYGNDISFPTASKGYAVAFNQEDQSSLLVFQ